MMSGDIIQSEEMNHLFFAEVRKIVGCAFRVYNSLGSGFLEAIYRDALMIEFRDTDIPAEMEKHLDVYYKGEKLPSTYKTDIICYGQIILELKAVTKLTDADSAQLLHYLKATGIKTGILFNFGKKGKLEWKRLVYTDEKYLKNENIPNTS
ncbi:GxxExxY protein [Methanocorpusculum parvum]|nr:GxxExxY protein [Methanocorpusculum parvum]